MWNRTKTLEGSSTTVFSCFFFSPVGQFLPLCFYTHTWRLQWVTAWKTSQSDSHPVSRDTQHQKQKGFCSHRRVKYTHITLGCCLHVLAPVGWAQGALFHSQQQVLCPWAGSNVLVEANSSSDYSAPSKGEKPPEISVPPGSDIRNDHKDNS